MPAGLSENNMNTEYDPTANIDLEFWEKATDAKDAHDNEMVEWIRSQDEGDRTGADYQG